MSKVKHGKSTKGAEQADFYFWGFNFNPVKIAQSWQSFFSRWESAVPDSVREKARLRMRAATLNYAHDVATNGMKMQRDAAFEGLKAGAEALISQKGMPIYAHERLLWFETVGDGLFMLWDPRGAKVLRDMAKGLRELEGDVNADAASIAGRLDENAKLLEESKSLPSMRDFEDVFKWTKLLQH